MEYSITDPSTAMPFKFQVKPENFNGEPGYRIISSVGSSFFIANKYGVWRSLDDHKVDSELLEKIGLAIEGEV